MAEDKEITIHDLPTNHPIYKEIEKRTTEMEQSLFLGGEKISLTRICKKIVMLEIQVENLLNKK